MLIAIAALLVGTIHSAQAEFKLKLTSVTGSATNSKTVTDQDLNDTSSVLGQIKFNGSIGDFLVSFTVGESKPLQGSQNSPLILIDSVDAVNLTAGSKLTIEASDRGFGLVPLPATFLSTLNGKLMSGPGTLSVAAYFDNSNSDFATANQVGSISLSGPGLNRVVTGTQSALSPAPTNPFSLNLVTTIQHDGAYQTTQFTAQVQTVPEPSASLCLGIALFSLAGFCWWRQKQNNDTIQG
jgi:hypothetical protein